MKLTKELLEKAKTAKSAEELLELAKAEGVEMTAEEAEKTFAEMNRSGELADEELDNVAGGGCGDPENPSPLGLVKTKAEVVYLYEVNQVVEVYVRGNYTKTYTILERYPKYDGERGGYRPIYFIKAGANYAEDVQSRWINQDEIEM